MNNQFVSRVRQEKKTLLFVTDFLLIALSVFFAFAVRFELMIPGRYFYSIIRLILICEFFTLGSLYNFKLYSFSWSYISARDLISLIKSVALAFLLTMALLFALRESPFFSGFPRSIILISYFFIFVLCGGARFAKRFYSYAFPGFTADGGHKVLLVGAGDAGEQIVRSIIGSRTNSHVPAAFVDDNKSKWGTLIHGIKVVGPIEMIPEIVKKEKIEEMIIALPSAGSKTIKRAVELGRKSKLEKIRIVPSITEIIDGQISINQVRDVEVEDLLERDEITLDMRAIENFIGGKTILVTGAAGSIGSELCRQVAKFNPLRLVVVDQDETGIFYVCNELKKTFPNLKISNFIADIQNGQQINYIFIKCKPDIVLHAAAYKHVPLMEANVGEAVRNNVFGTKTVGEAAVANGAEKFIFISTDKAINPTSVMGATKRIGEMICQNLNQNGRTKFISVRFGNVLGSRGSVIPIFREQIKKGGPVEVTDREMKRYFMLTSEACLLVMQAGAMGQGGEVFVLDMGKPIKILDLARDMIRLSGFEPDKDIAIVYAGIRPGEKLFEELLTAEEGTVATHSDKIFIAKLSPIESKPLEQGLISLEKESFAENTQGIIELFKILIPNFRAVRQPLTGVDKPIE